MTFVFLFVAHVGLLFAQSESYQLSTHILDISAGHSASGMKVSLFKLGEKENWEFITDKCMDTNGRVKDLLIQTNQINKGEYKLKFHVSSAFVD